MNPTVWISVLFALLVAGFLVYWNFYRDDSLTPVKGTEFYIKIPASLDPWTRMELYEEPLIEAFAPDRLGSIIGGGTMMSEAEGISYCGIEVVVSDVERGIEVMREVLVRQGAPEDTKLIQVGPSTVEHPLNPRG